MIGSQAVLFSGILALSQATEYKVLTFYLTLTSAADTSAGGNASMYAVLVKGDTAQQRASLINNDVALPIYIVCTQNGIATQQARASEQVFLVFTVPLFTNLIRVCEFEHTQYCLLYSYII